MVGRLSTNDQCKLSQHLPVRSCVVLSARSVRAYQYSHVVGESINSTHYLKEAAGLQECSKRIEQVISEMPRDVHGVNRAPNETVIPTCQALQSVTHPSRNLAISIHAYVQPNMWFSEWIISIDMDFRTTLAYPNLYGANVSLRGYAQ